MYNAEGYPGGLIETMNGGVKSGEPLGGGSSGSQPASRSNQGIGEALKAANNFAQHTVLLLHDRYFFQEALERGSFHVNSRCSGLS